MLFKTVRLIKETIMRYLAGFLLLVLASTSAIADHHALNLEARQPRAEMTITSIDLGEDLTVITAEGDMDGYGKVYVSYHLTYNRDGSGGFYLGQGRGYIDENTMASGSFSGVWVRDGHLVRLTGVVALSDGSQNLDVIVVDPLNRTMIVDAYALKD
jgi:hypothetical protein